jgi:hypothetical protein
VHRAMRPQPDQRWVLPFSAFCCERSGLNSLT